MTEKSKGDRLRDAREARKMSTHSLAKLAGIREAFLIAIEDSRETCHTRTFQKLADILGVRLEFIFGQEDLVLTETLQDVLPEGYYWFVKTTMRIIIVLGSLALISALAIASAFIYGEFLSFLHL